MLIKFSKHYLQPCHLYACRQLQTKRFENKGRQQFNECSKHFPVNKKQKCWKNEIAENNEVWVLLAKEVLANLNLQFS
jgi:hypothetical protein